MADKDEQITESQEESKDESTKVTEEDLAKEKAELEAKGNVEEETPAETPDAEKAETTESESEAQAENQTFTKKFPNIKGDTPQEYAANLEVAYENSFAELHRLKQPTGDKTDDTKNEQPASPAVSYAEQLWQNETNKAWGELIEKYPQVQDLDNFEKFKAMVQPTSALLTAKQGYAPTIGQAYLKTAEELGWQPVDSKEKLGAAVKDNIAAGKSSSVPKQAPKTKISEAVLAANRKMFPNKTDAQIIEELTPYINS